MTDQRRLRARIANAKALQEIRIRRVAMQKKQLDALVEEKDREIANLEAQLLMRVVG